MGEVREAGGVCGAGRVEVQTTANRDEEAAPQPERANGYSHVAHEERLQMRVGEPNALGHEAAVGDRIAQRLHDPGDAAIGPMRRRLACEQRSRLDREPLEHIGPRERRAVRCHSRAKARGKTPLERNGPATPARIGRHAHGHLRVVEQHERRPVADSSVRSIRRDKDNAPGHRRTAGLADNHVPVEPDKNPYPRDAREAWTPATSQRAPRTCP
jgi:hypothetical protein